MAHTPGPWHTTKMRQVFDGEGNLLADVGMEDDANLMALSPEMKDALKDLLQAFTGDIFTIAQRLEIINRVNTLLARAEGHAP